MTNNYQYPPQTIVLELSRLSKSDNLPTIELIALRDLINSMLNMRNQINAQLIQHGKLKS